MPLTDDQKKVLFHLAEHPDSWWSPTKLGEQIGQKPYTAASSWGSAQGKALVNLGYAERSDKGHYRVTEAGRNAATALGGPGG